MPNASAAARGLAGVAVAERDELDVLAEVAPGVEMVRREEAAADQPGAQALRHRSLPSQVAGSTRDLRRSSRSRMAVRRLSTRTATKMMTLMISG